MRRSSPRARGSSPGCQGALVPSPCWTAARPSMTPVVVGCPVATACSTRAIRRRPAAAAAAENVTARGMFVSQASTPAGTSAPRRDRGWLRYELGWGSPGRRGICPVARRGRRISWSRCRGVLGSAAALAECRERRCGRRSRRRGSTETTAPAGSAAVDTTATLGERLRLRGRFFRPRGRFAVLDRSARDRTGAAISGFRCSS